MCDTGKVSQHHVAEEMYGGKKTMKKLLTLLLVLAMTLSLVACGGSGSAGGSSAPQVSANPADDIPDEMTSSDGKYQVAFIADVGQLKDKSFNQGTYDGVKLYAANNDKTYKYYQPAGGDQATDEDRADAFNLACQNGAEIVIAAGFIQEAALRMAAEANPDVKFVFIDGSPIVGNDGNILTNVAAVAFRDEQCGYLAGYATVMEGYTKLGFMGGGGGTNPACQRYGYGFAQGASAAAAELGVQVEMNYSWAYGATFTASPELQTMATGWYANGTEVIFCCGGTMFQSVAAAASTEDGLVVGVDVDQSFDSPAVITSAVKGLADAAQWAAGQFYAGNWDQIGGVVTSLGAADNAVGLPTATWSMTNWSLEDYEAMFAKIAAGEVEISTEQLAVPGNTANMTVNYVE